MRRTLGVMAIVASLSAIAAAQIPGTAPPPPPKYPRFELYGAYAYGRTDLFNSGDTARLNGWNGSAAVNAAKWLGFLFEASGLYGNSKIPSGVPKPFPICGGTQDGFCPPPGDTFNVNTKLYNYLFGAQLPYRKWGSITPFGEVLFGHSGVRGEARDKFGKTFAEVSGGWGLVGGAGVDFNVNPRFAVRVKADYLQTRMFDQKQANLKFTVGIVVRSVRKKKRTLEDEVPSEPAPETPPKQQ